MDEYLDGLDTSGPDLPAFTASLPDPLGTWSLKALKAAASRLEISGRSRMKKAALIEAIEATDTEPLFDF